MNKGAVLFLSMMLMTLAIAPGALADKKHSEIGDTILSISEEDGFTLDVNTDKKFTETCAVSESEESLPELEITVAKEHEKKETVEQTVKLKSEKFKTEDATVHAYCQKL